MKKSQTLSISCDKARITSMVKPEKDSIRKKDDRPITFMNKDTETIIKIFEIQIPWYIRRITHHNQVGFIIRIQS